MTDLAQTPLELDHVVVCVPDIEDGVERFEQMSGLESVPGGKHAGHGTQNAIVPFHETYLELVTIFDHAEAMESPFGSWVAERCYRSEYKADAVCLRTQHIGPLTSRLGLEPNSMSRVTDDGRRLNWTTAGLSEALGSERLPFFIEWHINEADHPGNFPDANRDTQMVGVTLSGSLERLGSWLGDPVAGVHLEEGAPGIRQVGIRTSGGGVLNLSGDVT